MRFRTKNNKSQRIEKKKVQSYYDISLLLLTVFLCVFGLVMIYSISYFNAYKFYTDSKKYLNRQAVFVVLGLIIMFIVSMIDYRFYMRPFGRFKIRLVTLIYFACVALQIAVRFIGSSAGGAARWISLPIGFKLQPSELLKVAFILFTAYIIASAPNALNRFMGLVRVLVYISVPIVFVAMENLSTAIILAVISIGMCFVASKKIMYFVFTGAAGIAAAAASAFLVGYRSERIDTWLHPETMENGSQIMQGMYAIASGGLLGRGLGGSLQKMGNIQEVHTDMIFTVICEELGILGGIAVIALFLMMIWRLFKIAINAPDLFGGMITFGVLINIAVQVVINIAVVTNSIPATGIPLPFISYGGSSLLVLLVEIGLALSVSNQTVKEIDA